MSDLVGNPEDRFSRVEAPIIQVVSQENGIIAYEKKGTDQQCRNCRCVGSGRKPRRPVFSRRGSDYCPVICCY